MDLNAVIKYVIKLCKEVSPKILEIYNSNDLNVEIKSDNSPVTKADKFTDEFLRENLKSEYPEIGFLTEESKDDLSRLNKEYIWIIDPIDGTKDFIAHDDEYSINVALCKENQILLGVIYAPVSGNLYYAIKGGGSYGEFDGKKEKLHVSNRLDNLRVVTSKFHLNDVEKEMLNKHKDSFEKVFMYGSSLKGCLIARGDADISYRFSSGTKEWDTAAMNIIINEAGGIILQRDGSLIRYNKEDVHHHNGYVICNSYKNFLKYN